MAKIIVLDPATINQIAAGEVIERPASVVKELVENSLDAGARHITVTITGGGIEGISVVDDGCGIAAEEVLLAFERHATSKIRTIDDVYHLTSLGFRGEALPSIAAVSRVEMKTRPPEDEKGIKVEICGGTVVSKTVVGCAAGTAVTVRDLFFNLPARRKHLKSPTAELTASLDMAQRLALSAPGVAFRFFNNRRLIFATTGNGLNETVASIWGTDLARELLAVKSKEGMLSLEGLVSPLHVTRPTGRQIVIFLNGRYIRNEILSGAVLDAYRHYLGRGSFPVAVLYLQVDPRRVDANVHPQKLDVRISSLDTVFQVISRTIREVIAPRRPVVWPAGEIAGEKFPKPPGVTKGKDFQWKNIEEEKTICKGEKAVCREESRHDVYHVTREYTVPGEEKPESLFTINDSCYLGFLPPVYLLVRQGEDLLIVDTHAAHERILYEEFRQRLEAKVTLAQPLLFPEKLNLTPEEWQAASKGMDFLHQAGFEWEAISGGTCLLRAAPVELPAGEATAYFRELCALLAGPRPPTGEDLYHKAAALLACRAAVKAGERIADETAMLLLRRWQNCREPFTCPHGRPVSVQLTANTLRQMFRR